MTSTRFYELLLYAYPRRFRMRYGSEMRRVFQERLARASSHGPARVAVLLAASVCDVLWNATLERITAAGRWFRFDGEADRRAKDGDAGQQTFWQSTAMDLRYAVRISLRAPLYTGLAVLALALGVGAVSAIFSVGSGILLKALPYDQPDRLVMVWSDNTRESRPEYPMSPANFLDYKAAARRVERVEAMFSFITNTTLKTEAGAEQVTASVVSPGMFSVLGRTAAVGRTLTPRDSFGAVVLSDGFWARRFGRDASIIGRRIVVDAAPGEIVGIMPPDFAFPFPGMLGPSGFTTRTETDMWAVLDPANQNSRFLDADKKPVRNVHFLSVIGRLVPGATLAQARDEALEIARGLEQAYPTENRGLRANVVSLHEQTVGTARPAILLLGAGACFVLLLACVNVANLVLAKSLSRQKEMAVRAALGAGRWRLARQTLAETLLLSGAGGAAGLLLAWWATRAFVSLAPRTTPRLTDIGLDWRVVIFTLSVAIATGVVLGLIPVIASASKRTALADTARGNSEGVSGRRLRSALATVEVTLAVVLTIGAGLLIRSFVTLMAVDPGFQAERLLTMQIQLPATIATPDARRAFYRDLFGRLEALPGVTRVGGTTRVPLGSTNVTSRVTIEGGSPAGDSVEVEFRRAMHAYFPTMGMPILRGRDFSDTDGPTAPPIVVINQAMARKVWGNEDPVGKHVRTGNAQTPWSTVVGVVGDLHHANLDQPPAPEMYIYYLAGPPVSPYIVLRTMGDPATLSAAVRATLKDLDKDLVVYDLRTGDDLRSAALSPRRFIAVLATIFGVLALTLAAVGVYGVMALMVTERTREMGIRMALGAAPVQVLGLVARQGMKLAAVGVALGLAASVALTPLMATQLFGVRALDPVTLASVPAILFVTALVACAVPARRAMRVDPNTTLRDE